MSDKRRVSLIYPRGEGYIRGVRGKVIGDKHARRLRSIARSGSPLHAPGRNPRSTRHEGTYSLRVA